MGALAPALRVVRALRAGQGIGESAAPELFSWSVDGVRRTGTVEHRHAIMQRAYSRFVEPAATALPRPHDPLFAIDALAPFDLQTIKQRMDELGYDPEERDMLAAELEGVAHGFLDDAGAVSILRLHALAGRSLELAEDAGGRYTFGSKTRGLIDSMAAQAPFAQWLSTPVDSLGPVSDGVEVRTRNGDVLRARTCVLTVPLNVLPHVRFDDLSAAKRDAIALGQASRGIKLWLRVKGESRGINAISPGHPFGYLMVDRLLPDGTQLLVGFGIDAANIDLEDRPALQRSLDELHPGLEIVDTRRTTGSPTNSRSEPGPFIARAGTRVITRRCGRPSGGSCSPDPISPTAGAAMSTAPSSPVCARHVRCRRC